jgi:hypothetical protein
LADDSNFRISSKVTMINEQSDQKRRRRRRRRRRRGVVY